MGPGEAGGRVRGEAGVAAEAVGVAQEGEVAGAEVEEAEAEEAA